MNKKYCAILSIVLLSVLVAFALRVCGDAREPAVADIPLEQKIGQMLMVGFRGFTVSPQSMIVQDIEAGRIGGVVLFDRDVALGSAERNIKSPEQVNRLIASLQGHAHTPLFVGIDQEGGRVCRLKEEYGFPPTVSHQYLGDLDDPGTTFEYARKIAVTLAELGINVNFAPVVDVNVNPASPAIGALERSFSADPAMVVRHAEMFVRAHEAEGVITVLKHFPGHGSAMADSHEGFTDVTATWSPAELEPYNRLIATGRPGMIMTAHIFNARLDPDYPATLSRPTVTDLLRTRMQYRGVVVSDDMNMKAISENHGLETAVEKAVNAGVDILLFGNNLVYDPEIAAKAQAIILDLVKRGHISEARIDESYARIIALKKACLFCGAIIGD